MEHISQVNWWQRPSKTVAAASAVCETPEVQPLAARLPYYALCGFTCVLVVAPQDLVPALAPLRLAFVAAVVAVMMLVGTRAGRAQALAVRAPEFAIAGALLLWIGLTMPLSYWPGGSMTVLLDRLAKALVVFALLGVTVTSTARLRTLFWLLSVFTLPISLTALLHYATGVVDASSGGRIIGYGRGLAANPNDLALTLDTALPLTLALMMSARTRTSRMFAAGIALLDVAAIIVTFSRGGFIGMGVVLSLFAWRRFRQAPWTTMAVISGLLVLVVPFVPAGFSDRLATVTNIQADPTGSAQDRWRDTVLAVKFIEAHPVVGAGLGNDILVLNELRGPTWRSVHNAYLNYGVDLGLPGLVLFAWLLIRCLRGAKRVERRRSTAPTPELSWLAGGVVMGLYGFAAAAFFYPVGYQFYFYYLAGLAVALQSVALVRGKVTGHAA